LPSQLLGHTLVAGFIYKELVPPEGTITLREMPVLRTTVPEAAIDKNNNPLFTKGEIWLAG